MNTLKNIIAATVATVALTSPALAQQTMTNTATSESLSQSGVHNEGDRVSNRSASAVAPSGNSTADCVMWSSYGIGLGNSGIGLSAGNSRINDECVTRIEAKILTEIAVMPRIQQRVAVHHFCNNDESMRDTMVAIGWCRKR